MDAVGASLDITDQKEVTIALTLAEARYRRLVETSPDGIFAVDLDGRFFEINPTVAKIFGRDPADVIGRTSREVVAPESQGAIRAEVARLATDPNARADYEAWIIRPTGERRLVHVRSTPIVNDGQVQGAHGVIRDITDDRLSETRVQLLGAAVESLGHGVAVSDVGGALVYANSEFANILAFDLDPDHLPSLNDFLPDDTAKEQMAQIDEMLRTQGRWSGRIWRRRAADGRVVPLDAVIGSVPSPRGGPPHALTICHEATEAIQRDQQLRRAERLSSLGTLVGGVAHELNNPLNAIINFAALLLTQTRDDEEREDLETIVREGERAAKIVSGLRAIARQADIDQSPKEPVDVNDVVTHVLKLRSYTLSTSNIVVETRLAENLPLIWADRGQVEQVVLNLVINAEQAMAAYHAEGRLRVGTTLGRLGVLLEVTDDGPGIESSNIERIFDPFWTTKAPGEGTGLGLSLVHNIVEEHGGVIDLRSEVGVGTTFYVDMPAAESSTAPEPGGTEPADSPRPLRILVVDDEAAVRRSLVRYLEREGHHVDQAAEGGEALRKVSLSVSYDVILSDLRMPGIDGEQLLLRLKERGRGDERKVVFMTGDATGVDLGSDGGIPLLLIKPVKLSDVGAAIRQKAGEIPPRTLEQSLVA